jgi:DNA polymerase I-like protein with 3'-5' exonuclease and polymerase domains
VHYACRLELPKAREAAQRYIDDPSTDFHDLVTRMIHGDNLSPEEFKKLRKPCKDTNFAKCFGAGVPKFAAMINKPEDEAQAIYDLYDRELPFVQQAFDYCERLAQRRGYILLYDGARRHWDDWEPKYLSRGERDQGFSAGNPMYACKIEEARARCADASHVWFEKRLRRSQTRKAFNALIQGGAARHTKLWMRAVYREGVVPLLQLHDELDSSVKSRAEGEMIQRLGCEAVRLEVPVQVEVKYGRSWGDAKHEWEDVK